MQREMRTKTRREQEDDIPPPPNALTEEEIHGGIKVTGLHTEKSVKLALKIVSHPRFLSPGNSLHRESVRSSFRPTPYFNDLPTALTSSFFSTPLAWPRTQCHHSIPSID